MNQLSRQMRRALDTVSAMPLDQQDLLAVELLERAAVLSSPPLTFSPQERAELEADLAAARRGEFATEEEVAAMYAKYGL